MLSSDAYADSSALLISQWRSAHFTIERVRDESTWINHNISEAEFIASAP